MTSRVRALRLATPEYFERDAINRTKEQASEISELAEKLRTAITRKTIAPEMRLRLEPEIDGLLASLDRVHQQCDNAISSQPGKTDEVLRWCAGVAFDLVYRFSGKMPTSGSARSPYRVIASLLYEVVTDEAEHDLRRACDDLLKSRRELAHTITDP